MEQAANNYMNTLTFAVIAQALAVLIIGSLAFSVVKPFAPFLLTVLIGLLIVIAWSLYAIRAQKSRLEDQFKSINKTLVRNVPCPDYYVRDGDEAGNTICKNGYTTPDRRISYKFHTRSPNEAYSDEQLEEIPVDEIFAGKKLQDVCSDSLESSSLYGQIPWTGVKPNCQDLGDADSFTDYLKN